MTLFSEVYNCYYQIVYDLITRSIPLTKEEIVHTIQTNGYEESMLYLLPKLIEDSGTSWNLFTMEDTVYYPNVQAELAIPLSNLQKSWLKPIPTHIE